MGMPPKPFRNGTTGGPETLLFQGSELSLGLNLAVVVEPVTLGMILLGGLALIRRRREVFEPRVLAAHPQIYASSDVQKGGAPKGPMNEVRV